MTPLISPALQRMMDASPDIWAFKDTDLVCRYANDANARAHGFRAREEAFGRTDYELPGDIAACAPLFQASDREVLETGQTLRMLDVHPLANGHWHAFLCTKFPLPDRHGNRAGLLFCGIDISAPQVLELGRLLASMVVNGNDDTRLIGSTSYVINRDRGPVRLTRREAEVLFFLLRCLTVPAIARALSLSPRTVEQHLEGLRQKFGAATRPELVDRALQAGYLNFLPESLFTRQLSIILREQGN